MHLNKNVSESVFLLSSIVYLHFPNYSTTLVVDPFGDVKFSCNPMEICLFITF